MEGVRKPEPAIYQLMCQRMGEAPQELVFLDDIGRNLKPAAAMGVLDSFVRSPETFSRPPTPSGLIEVCACCTICGGFGGLRCVA